MTSTRCSTAACGAGLYRPGDWLIFGAETTGLPAEVHGPQIVYPIPVSMLCVTCSYLHHCALAVCQVYRSVEEEEGHVLTIPIDETHVRSLNLAVSAGVGLYEALRQLDDPAC